MSDRAADILSQHAATASELTDRLTAIWQDVLHVDTIAVTDNFFDLGGHSVFAVQIVARIRNEFAVDVPVRVVFDYPSVSGLAAVLSRMSTEQKPPDRRRLTLRKRETEDG